MRFLTGKMFTIFRVDAAKYKIAFFSAETGTVYVWEWFTSEVAAKEYLEANGRDIRTGQMDYVFAKPKPARTWNPRGFNRRGGRPSAYKSRL